MIDRQKEQDDYLIFRIEDKFLALYTEDISNVIRAVYVTPLFGKQELIQGVVDVRGKMTLILDMHRYINAPTRPLKPSDRLIIIHNEEEMLGFTADEVIGVFSLSRDSWTCPEQLHHDLEHSFTAITEWQGENVFLFDHHNLFALLDFHSEPEQSINQASDVNPLSTLEKTSSR